MKILKTLFAALVISAPAAAATDIEVSFSDAFAERLAEDYGEREGERLVEDVTNDIERALARRGADPARIEVTIIDAKPSRPTREQLDDRIGFNLTLSSGFGGMSIEGRALDSDGAVIAEASVESFENSNTRALGPRTTWGDAQSVSNRFARQLARRIEG